LERKGTCMMCWDLGMKAKGKWTTEVHVLAWVCVYPRVQQMWQCGSSVESLWCPLSNEQAE